jgi:ferrous iron transport protein B
VWEKTWSYVKKAGTIILAASILVWVITTFPVYEATETDLAVMTEAELGEKALEQSYAGRLGTAIAPVFAPLGFDWKLATATVTGFAAKEVIVSTLGILYSVGGEETEESTALQDAIHNDPYMTPLIAFAFMLFTLVIPPCFAALATIKAEIGWKWLVFEIVFLLAVGWMLAFMVYQGGRLFGLA